MGVGAGESSWDWIGTWRKRRGGGIGVCGMYECTDVRVCVVCVCVCVCIYLAWWKGYMWNGE